MLKKLVSKKYLIDKETMIDSIDKISSIKIQTLEKGKNIEPIKLSLETSKDNVSKKNKRYKNVLSSS